MRNEFFRFSKNQQAEAFNLKEKKMRTIEVNNTQVEVTPDGLIYQEGKELKQRLNSYGYKIVYIGAKCFRVHRIIAEAYSYKPESNDKLSVHHVDENKLNNNAENLVWITQAKHIQLHKKEKTLSKPRIDNQNQIIGVYPFPIGNKPFRAVISDFKKSVFTIGYFSTIEAATTAFTLANSVRISKGSFTKQDLLVVKQQLKTLLPLN